MDNYLKRQVYDCLLTWKNHSEHSTLEVSGARQVGKTYIVTEPLPAKAGRFGLLLKQPKVVASSLISFST